MPFQLSPSVRRLVGPLEIYVAVVFAASVVFLLAQGFRIDATTFRYTLWPFVKAIPTLLALGIGAQVLFHLVVGLLQKRAAQALGDYARSLLDWRWWELWLRLLVAYMLTNYVYFWVKVTIPLVNERVWDDFFSNLDRWLHLGLSPTIFLVSLLEGQATWVRALDVWYGWWIQSVMLVIAFFSCAKSARIRRSFMLSCCLMWSVGTYLYLAFPTLGPAYSRPAEIAPIVEHMPAARGGQALLIGNYQKMVAGRSAPLYSFNPTQGVAAMPSLHVAAHVLFVLWVRRLARPLLLPFVLAALLTFVGSVVTGWHFAVDGYVGAVLAWGSYRVALLLEGVAPEERLTPLSSREDHEGKEPEHDREHEA